MTASTVVTPPARLRRRPARLAALVVAVVGLWILLGLTRAPTVAHDYWASSHPGATEVSVDIRLQPAVPPFWGVTVNGTYAESSGARVPSAMILWVEPFSGFVLVMGQG
ncbi:MAG TPA: hypothetical protein VF494_01070 [Candidatus Limnocylindrales bacterium]